MNIYSKKQYYNINECLYRDKSKITCFHTIEEAELHAKKINDISGVDTEINQLLNNVRDELTLHTETNIDKSLLLDSLIAMIDSRVINN